MAEDSESHGHYARLLTKEEVEFLQKDTETLTDFKRAKHKKE